MTEWPLGGRESELTRLDRLFEAGERGAVLVGGRGVGKTRLGVEFLTRVGYSGQPVIRVAGTQAARMRPLHALASALPPLAPGPDTGGSQIERLQGYAAAVLQQAHGRRLVLLVDDGHLLDEVSSILVHQMALGGQAFVVATLLAGEVAPDPIVALWKDGLAERLEVDPLGPEMVEQVLSAVLGAPLDPVALAQLTACSEGNLVVLKELVGSALRDGSLRDDGGIWRIRGGLTPPESLVELIEAELSELEPAERALLELVSFGEPLGSAEVEALADRRLIEQLERRGLVLSRMSGRRLELQIRRRIHGDVLRSRLPVVRRTAIVRSLAAVVEASGARRQEDTLRDAVWRLEGGWARPELMLAAAETARKRYDYPLAERLARAAVQAGAGFEAEVLAARLAASQGRSAEAEAEFSALALRAGTEDERGAVIAAHLRHQLFNVGRVTEGLRFAEEARSQLISPIWRDEIAAHCAGVLLTADGPRAAVEAAGPLLESAQGRALVFARLYTAMGLGRLGRIEHAIDMTGLAHAAHLALGQSLESHPSGHLVYRCDALAYAGRIEEAEALAAELYRAALSDRSTEAQAFFAWQLSKTVGERGHVQTAARHAREAIALFRQLGRRQPVRGCLVHLAMALALAGRPQEAKEVLTGPDAPDFATPLYTTRVDLLLAWAWTAVAEADFPKARRFLRNAVALAGTTEDAVGESVALHGLARLGRSRDVVRRLEALSEDIEGDLVSTRAVHARCLTNNDPEGLESVSASFATMGANLLAAEAAADAAVSWRTQGDPRRAAAARRLSEVVAARCEGAVTPALRAVESRVQLTPAEADAAGLAAAGRSNREIALALCLSVRTVENQLQRVYNKLGVSSRAELAAVLGSDPGPAPGMSSGSGQLS